MEIPSTRFAALGTLASAVVILGALVWNAVEPSGGRTEILVLLAPVALLPAIAVVGNRVGGLLGSSLTILGLVAAGGFVPALLLLMAGRVWPIVPEVRSGALLGILALIAAWVASSHLAGGLRRSLPGVVAASGTISGLTWLVLLASVVVTAHAPRAGEELMPLWAANILVWVVVHPVWTVTLSVWLVRGANPPISRQHDVEDAAPSPDERRHHGTPVTVAMKNAG